MEESNSADHVVVFRTGKLWEFDLGRNALQEHGIPFFARTESISGVMTALDAMPTTAPGISWSLLVPREAAQKAREVLRECRLDIEKDPEVWDFAPTPKVKKYWKMYIWAVIILTALLFLVEIAPRILP